MRTTWAVVLVLGLGFSFSVLTASGVGPAIFGQEAGEHGGLGPMEKLNETGGDASNYNLSGDVAGEDERNIVGFIIDGGRFLFSVAAAVVFVPGVLIGLGLPSYFAIPGGMILQFIAVVGIIQFATNRIYR